MCYKFSEVKLSTVVIHITEKPPPARTRIPSHGTHVSHIFYYHDRIAHYQQYVCNFPSNLFRIALLHNRIRCQGRKTSRNQPYINIHGEA
jgi:hypothetical protein